MNALLQHELLDGGVRRFKLALLDSARSLRARELRVCPALFDLAPLLRRMALSRQRRAQIIKGTADVEVQLVSIGRESCPGR